MGRSEAALWQLVRLKLKPYDADLERIENGIGYGTPDVNYCLTYGGVTAEGWLELKELEHWPVDPARVVRIEHYTPQQRVWARRRWLRGGRVFFLLRVKATGHIMLLDGPVAAARAGLDATAGDLLGLGETALNSTFPSPAQLARLTMPRAAQATRARPTTGTPALVSSSGRLPT